MKLTEESLEKIIQKIEDMRDKNINEPNTKAILIEPVLTLLDWNISNVEEVNREFYTSTSKYVDYKLSTNDQVIFIEAKPLNEGLSKHQKQITTYAYTENVPFCVLTNGDTYQIFETLKDVSDKLIYEITITDKEVSINEKVESLSYLSKENIGKGGLKELNNLLSINSKVHEYLQKLLSKPDISFIKFIENETGLKNNEEYIKKAIISYGEMLERQTFQFESITADEGEQVKEEQIDIDYLINKLKSKELQEIFLTLRERILTLGSDIKQMLYKQFNSITYKRDTEFTTVKVKPYNEEIEIFFKFGENEPNLSEIEKIDVGPIPKTTRWGRVNYRTIINSKDQINDALKLIKRCYELQLKWRK